MNGQLLDMYTETLSGTTENLTHLITNNIDTLFPEVWKLVSKVYLDVAIPIAGAMIVIYFLVSFVGKQIEAGENVGIHSMAKPLIQFVLGLAIIFTGASGGRNLMISTYELGQGATNKLLEVVDIEDPEGVDNKETVEIINNNVADDFAKLDSDGNIVVDKKVSVVSGVFHMIKVILPWMTMLAANLYASIIIYGRLFEIYIRYALSPIALSDMFMKGTESSGYRYIKNFLALILQGMMILLVLSVYGKTQAAGFVTGIGLWGRIAMTVAFAAVLGKTRSLSNSLLGVH